MASPTTPHRATKKAPPFFRLEWEVADASALQALARGDATPEQQKRALEWTVKNAALAYDVSFQPESDRASSFAEGRRFVGLKIIELLSVSTRDLLRKQHPTP